jgi:hypothetical protein
MRDRGCRAAAVDLPAAERSRMARFVDLAGPKSSAVMVVPQSAASLQRGQHPAIPISFLKGKWAE